MPAVLVSSVRSSTEQVLAVAHCWLLYTVGGISEDLMLCCLTLICGVGGGNDVEG